MEFAGKGSKARRRNPTRAITDLKGLVRQPVSGQ